ncbi:1-(5-phosphoribosyl)-5-[(5-phosphoribosylamino)methylideneamino]imidazole-4-carboxamide isomerase [Azospirillum sp. SYSU D00513]|uniref:1-(5-phosphoribosyl)-5-[(5- phosphoribosylamino)methylideneamino]imidazole-4- carboxamide isomerase n=1 Tax=Azospirillum sp. SYSU D00513 TaxID=2812561 RepID=UPI001A972443|nr:1-(5-phosphoribosyl)-5-[(5-phosphoribosylamino)methylideneamino]imidazole-4-carboxamide isomerase [Azospirillum sp. SYSU D00513]
MILYPAIDLKDGACVRLLRGEMSQATVFNTDPGEQARQFQDQGFEWLHLVDLNGAFEGRPVNAEAVDRILASVSMPVQLGGGIRDLKTIGMWLERGVRRVILGTIALRDPALVKDACRAFPGKVAVGIDAREGFVAVSGWAETSNIKALDLALKFEDSGVAAIIYTDINRDGAMAGVNVEATSDLAFHLTTPVIASGGVSSIDDLRALKTEEHTGIEGVICGRALYDGRIDPAEALALLSAPAVPSEAK